MRNCSACPSAVAYIQGGEGNQCLRGEVRFYQQPRCVLVVAYIAGLPSDSKGFCGFHIHEGNTCEGDFSSTGGHYNPDNTMHPNHAGDLPPLMVRENGHAYMAVKTDRFRVGDIIGRTVVIHSDADDFTSQPSGASGKKIACGVIRRT